MQRHLTKIQLQKSKKMNIFNHKIHEKTLQNLQFINLVNISPIQFKTLKKSMILLTVDLFQWVFRSTGKPRYGAYHHVLLFTSCNCYRLEFSFAQKGVCFGVLLFFCVLFKSWLIFSWKTKMASSRAPSGQSSFKIRPLWPEHEVPVGRHGGIG